MINTLTLSAALGFGVTTMPLIAEEMLESMDNNMPTATYSNDWKAPAAIEFDRLDSTGNGLLLPNEASKGKAFNKKTFAQADADKDGYIDVNEYTYHKTGQWPENAQANSMATSDMATSNTAAGSALVSEDPMMVAENQTSTNNDTSDNANKRSVGVVVEDSVITTKAKAKILATEDLKSLQISVQTREGEVTLSGAVDNEAAKMKAEQVVSQIEGVKSVNNTLEVRS